MLPNDLQDLGHVYLDALTVPPLLLTVVAREEDHFGPVGEEMLDLNDVSL